MNHKKFFIISVILFSYQCLGTSQKRGDFSLGGNTYKQSVILGSHHLYFQGKDEVQYYYSDFLGNVERLIGNYDFYSRRDHNGAEGMITLSSHGGSIYLKAWVAQNRSRILIRNVSCHDVQEELCSLMKQLPGIYFEYAG